jgi:hypothetical protein
MKINTVSSKLRSPLYILVLASFLAVAIGVGVRFALIQPGAHQALVGSAAGPLSSPSAQSASSPSTASAVSPEPASSPNPVAVGNPAQFACGLSTISAQQPPTVAFMNSLRTGSHAGYDRLTIQFENGQPGTIELSSQTGTAFTRSPRGDTVSLAGTAGIRIVIRGADAHTSYSGANDFRTGGPALREVRQLEDFEGQVSWGLGLSGTGCYHAFVLANPTRLVVDVQVS